MKKTHLSQKLSAYSVAAGLAAVGAASTVEARMLIFDHRDTPLEPCVEHFAFDQTLAVLNVKTGDFQYVVEVGYPLNRVNEVTPRRHLR